MILIIVLVYTIIVYCIVLSYITVYALRRPGLLSLRVQGLHSKLAMVVIIIIIIISSSSSSSSNSSSSSSSSSSM